MRRMRVGLAGLALLALLAGVCSCQAIPEGSAGDCDAGGEWVRHEELFYGTSIDDFYAQLRDLQPKESWGAVKSWYFELLTDFPAPAEDPPDRLFGFEVLDRSSIKMNIWVTASNTASIYYSYQLTLHDPEHLVVSEPEESFDVTVKYTFYRFLKIGNEICEDVATFAEKTEERSVAPDKRELRDGCLYLEDRYSMWFFYDLNPGIGIVSFGMPRTMLPANASQLFPFEDFVALGKWKLISRETGKVVTDHVGWW